jgi:hypothetical protein
VLDGSPTSPTIVEHEYCTAPNGYRPDQLVWVRREVLEILERTQPDTVCYKGVEGNSQQRDSGRAEVEGVFQEAVRSCGLDPVKRVKSQIRSTLGYAPAARYILNILSQYPSLAMLAANRQEAALAALAALAE